MLVDFSKSFGTKLMLLYNNVVSINFSIIVATLLFKNGYLSRKCVSPEPKIKFCVRNLVYLHFSIANSLLLRLQMLAHLQYGRSL